MNGVLHAAMYGLLAGFWLSVLAVVGGAVALSTPWHAVRRGVLRARWRRVARSSGLAVHREHRDGERVEHLPTIAWGRGLPGGVGVRYRLRPARGGTLQDVADVAERLAAGLHVHRCEVERLRADKGRLVVVWRDPFTVPVAPRRFDPTGSPGTSDTLSRVGVPDHMSGNAEAAEMAR